MIKPEDVNERNRSNVLPKRVHKDTQKNTDTKSIVINRDIVREIGTWQTAVILAMESQKEHRKLKDLKGDEFVSGFSKEDKLIPVTTTVIYLAEEEWDGPRCLKDMMDLECLPKELQDRIADYPLDILEVRKFPDYEQFKTDLQFVFGFLQRDKNKEDLKQYVTDNQEVFADLEEDAYDMIADGKLPGKIQGIITACKEFDISKELAMNKIMKECDLSEAQTLEYITQYWGETS